MKGRELALNGGFVRIYKEIFFHFFFIVMNHISLHIQIANFNVDLQYNLPAFIPHMHAVVNLNLELLPHFHVDITVNIVYKDLTLDITYAIGE